MPGWEFTRRNIRFGVPTDDERRAHELEEEWPAHTSLTTPHRPREIQAQINDLRRHRWCCGRDGSWVPGTIEDAVGQLGREGWDLVSVVGEVGGGSALGGAGYVSTNTHWLYFKRPLDESG